MAKKRNVPYSSKKHKAERQRQTSGTTAVLSNERKTSSTQVKSEDATEVTEVTTTTSVKPVKSSNVPSSSTPPKKHPNPQAEEVS